MEIKFVVFAVIATIILISIIAGLYSNKINNLVSQYEKMENISSQVWDVLNIGTVTDDCYSKSEKECLNYSNCGLCRGKCVPGDVNGPFFESCDCDEGWVYGNYYDKYIFRSHDILKTPSYDTYKKFPPRKYIQTLM